MGASFYDRDNGYDATIKRLGSNPLFSLTIGIHGEEGGEAKKMWNNTTQSVEVSDSITVAEVAEAHEFGIMVPRRSFIASWFDTNKSRIEAQIKEGMDRYARGKADLQTTADFIGILFAGDVKKRIREGLIRPPTSQATLTAKNNRAGQASDASGTTLIDTGQLWTSVKHLVGRIRK